jgi:hypothetical protein
VGIDRDHPALPDCRYRLTRNLSRRLDSGMESEESTATFGFAGLSSVTPRRAHGPETQAAEESTHTVMGDRYGASDLESVPGDRGCRP